MAETTPDSQAAAKEKMRAALERKHGRERLDQPWRNAGAVHGSQVTGAVGKRTFRRKSG